MHPMKISATIVSTFGLVLGFVQAQTVPLYINYQGKVTNGDGVPLGSTGAAPDFSAAPENRKIIFRIFDAQTGGNRLWSEQQTVTISLGEFSVLLGQGTPAVIDGTTETANASTPTFQSVFTGNGPPPAPATGNITPDGPLRFLEIIVDTDANGTFTSETDLPITPRQRITTSAYSFRARVADFVQGGAIDATALAAGSVTAEKIADNQITSLKLAGLSVTTEKIGNNQITTEKIANDQITTAKIANGQITAAKLDPSIGIWSASGGNVARLSGNVGIGKQPTVPLDVAGAIAATGNITTAGNITAAGALTGSSISTSGPFSATTITANAGMRVTNTNVLELGAGVAGKEGSAGKIGYQTFSTALDIVGAGTTGANRKIKMWAEGGTEFNGRVGIGTPNPAVPLDVISQNDLTMTDNGYNNHQGSESGGTWRATSTYTANPLSIETYGMAGVGHLGGNRNAVAPVGIRSDGWIASGKGIMVYSDRRIKRDLNPSASEADLAAIQKLQVTDYRMVDPRDGGSVWRKGFIAQEVERVIPGAVTRSVEFVPDIFAVATSLKWHAGANMLSLTLARNHDLRVGDRVRLHVDGNRLDLNVREVPGPCQFVVGNCDRAPEKVLVYGKQVRDFRTVDYDRIFTTAVGALQQLKKEQDALVNVVQEENAKLQRQLADQEHRLAVLEAKEQDREKRFAALEKQWQSAGGPDPALRIVSKTPGASSH